jgi:hypothetical protein
MAATWNHREAASMNSIIDLGARHAACPLGEPGREDKTRVLGIQIMISDPGAHASMHQQHDFHY